MVKEVYITKPPEDDANANKNEAEGQTTGDDALGNDSGSDDENSSPEDALDSQMKKFNLKHGSSKKQGSFKTMSKSESDKALRELEQLKRQALNNPNIDQKEAMQAIRQLEDEIASSLPTENAQPGSQSNFNPRMNNYGYNAMNNHPAQQQQQQQQHFLPTAPPAPYHAMPQSDPSYAMGMQMQMQQQQWQQQQQMQMFMQQQADSKRQQEQQQMQQQMQMYMQMFQQQTSQLEAENQRLQEEVRMDEN